MQIEDIKTWQWVIIGAVVGLLFGAVHLWQGPSVDTENLETAVQGPFERYLLGMLPDGHAANLMARHKNEIGDISLVKNLMVHPPQKDTPNVYWVTGRAFHIVQERKDPKNPLSPVQDSGEWLPFKYPAKSPYKSFNGAVGTYPSIVEYLRAMHQRKDAKFSFVFAWWEKPAFALTLPAIAGVLVLGIAWPLTLRLMAGAGLAKQPTLKLPKNRKMAMGKAPVDTTAGDKQLDDLNAQMEKSLAGFASAPQPTEEQPPNAPVTPLTGKGVKPLIGAEPANPTAQEQEELEREYGGEYYPVVKSVHKKG